MKVIGITFIAVMIITFGTLYAESDVTPQNVTGTISHIQNSTFNITTNNFPYTDLYNEQPTVQNVVYNFMHGIVYAVLVEVHTLIPVIAYGVSDLPFLMKIGILCLVVMFMGLIFRGGYLIIALVFFIKEKRQSHGRVYE